jgi:tRNA A-37 threonylcarbamoyl transferase component Bud32
MLSGVLFASPNRRSSKAGAKARARGAAAVCGQLGRYQLLHPLGVGGMAEVFKARALGPSGFERDVVIKRILPAHGRDPEFVRMFVDEAKILGLLHHPNVVQVYDFGEDEGTPYLALEYVDGPSLSKVLRVLRSAGRRVPPAIAAYLAREVCRALDYVHNLHDSDGTPLEVVHRDVTPSNIVFTATGGVKLLDFGVAKFTTAEQLTKTGTVKGKPAYLAPEQLEGKPIDGRVDLFALGIVMHEALSLEHLFAGDSDLGTVKKIMEMEIPVPSSKRADVPEELDRIVMRALERDRERRYASAAEMARALDEFVIASRLRVDEVASFVADVMEAAATPPPAVYEVPGRAAGADGAEAHDTRRDLGLVLRMWAMGRRLGTHARGAIIVVATAAAVVAATMFGVRVTVTTTHNAATAAERAGDRAAACAPLQAAASALPGPPVIEPLQAAAPARPQAAVSVVRVLPGGRIEPVRR